MAARDDAFYNPVTRTLVVFTVVPGDNGGREIAVNWHVPPGEKLPASAHVHVGPLGVVAERFEILAGRCRARVGERTEEKRAPDIFEVPYNVEHVHPENTGEEGLHVRQHAVLDPPDLKTLTRLEKFFETFVALSQQGGVDRDGNIKDKLQAALTTTEFLLDPTYVTSMPRWLQKPLLGAAAEIARLRGYKAYHKPQLAPGGVG